MAKSIILKQLVNDEISMETTMSRLMVIASDLNNSDIYKWAEKELNGYNSSDTLPPYRKLGIGSITYSGFNGNYYVTDNPIPVTALSKNELELIKENFVFQSIKTLQEMAKQDSKEPIGIDLTFLAENFYKRHGVKCVSIRMGYSYANVADILSVIRTKLIGLLIKLDKEFGCLDDLDININEMNKENLEALNDSLRTIIYTDNRGEVL